MADEYIDNWLKKAESDLRLVEHELKLHDEEIVKKVHQSRDFFEVRGK